MFRMNRIIGNFHHSLDDNNDLDIDTAANTLVISGIEYQVQQRAFA